MEDRVLFTKNEQTKYGVRNGSRGTVIAIQDTAIAVELDSGFRTIVDAADFPHIRLGYALTNFAVQGRTLETAYILAGGPMQDHPTTYVQATRAKRHTTFYTTSSILGDIQGGLSNSELARQMARNPNLTLASDLLPETQPRRKQRKTFSRSSSRLGTGRRQKGQKTTSLSPPTKATPTSSMPAARQSAFETATRPRTSFPLMTRRFLQATESDSPKDIGISKRGISPLSNA